MSRITTITLASILIAGCDHAQAVTPAPSAVVAPVAVEPEAVCTAFDADLLIDVHLAKPTEFHSPRRISGYEVVAADGSKGLSDTHGGFSGVEFDTGAWTLPVGVYIVRTRVGECWSRWQTFQVTPNPNASGEGVTQTLPTPTPPRYSQTRCTTAADFGPGQSEVLTFNAPPGNYVVTATTYEVNHGPGFQLGQVETVMIGGFGSTEDVGDLENVHVSQPWSTPLPVGEVRVTGLRGSLHGRPSAVCVTVESR